MWPSTTKRTPGTSHKLPPFPRNYYYYVNHPRDLIPLCQRRHRGAVTSRATWDSRVTLGVKGVTEEPCHPRPRGRGHIIPCVKWAPREEPCHPVCHVSHQGRANLSRVSSRPLGRGHIILCVKWATREGPHHPGCQVVPTFPPGSQLVPRFLYVSSGAKMPFRVSRGARGEGGQLFFVSLSNKSCVRTNIFHARQT